MSGQKTRRSVLVGRVVIALLAVGVAILLAPVAAATPESDANDAITAAWDANGGADGTLGPKNGDVYPVGEGFGQNFASGKIFFTPATGAHIMAWRDPGEVRVGGRSGRQRPGFSHHR